MAQLGWALLFLLGSWSSVGEELLLPRTGSPAWDSRPPAAPLPGAEVEELLHGSPPSVRDVRHSGPPNRHLSGLTRAHKEGTDLQEVRRKHSGDCTWGQSGFWVGRGGKTEGSQGVIIQGFTEGEIHESSEMCREKYIKERGEYSSYL